MTPARLPPPGAIPVPVPSPSEPPAYEIEAEPFDEVPTKLERVCPGCFGAFKVLPNDAQPPASYAEAFRSPWQNGKPLPVQCRGTEDHLLWWFCREPVLDNHDRVMTAIGARGYLEVPGKLGVQFFPERRSAPR